MSDVQAALDAMRAAEDEARWIVDNVFTLRRWADDRLRLVERDRATLERHRASLVSYGHTEHGGIGEAETCWFCSLPTPTWPCPDAAAVIGYWTQEDE